MLLAVDVGNTNMVFGIFDEGKLVGEFRLKTEASRTSDEIGLFMWSYFQRFSLDANCVEDVIIASVAPQVMHSLTSAMKKYFDREPWVIDRNIDPGLPYGVDSNERLGADRAVADIAAMEKYGTPLVVLDFGTATTVDALSREGSYMGGCITAGVRVSVEALFQRASMLPSVELSVPETVLGSTAVGQIQAGTMMGYIGAMEYLISRTKAEMGYAPEEIKVVATGGLARVVADHTALIDVVDHSLILDGLYYIYCREKGNTTKS